MYVQQAAAGLGTTTWAAGQTLTAGDVVQINSMDSNAQQQAAQYSSCKSTRWLWAAGAAVAGFLAARMMK